MKKRKTNLIYVLFAVATILLAFGSCDKEDDPSESSIFKDPRDGSLYHTVKIDGKIWMAENLKYLPRVMPHSDASITDPKYYVYGTSVTDVNLVKESYYYLRYGVLYNWIAAKDACPKGWHLPTNDEFKQLVYYLGGENVAGGKLKETGTEYWDAPNEGATNESGFAARGGGRRDPGGFLFDKGIGHWWSATSSGERGAYSLYLSNRDRKAENKTAATHLGFSVRCVKNK